MKRLIAVLITGLLLIFSFTLVQAKPAQVSLANAFFADQMPAGADLYMAIRTDDAYLDELDGILNGLANGISSNFANTTVTADGFGVRNIMNQALANLQIEGDFDTAIRPWLGSSAALGIYWGEMMPENFYIAIDHSNRELAEAFIENLAERSLDVTVEGNFTIYASPNGMSFIGLNDDAIYITSKRELIPFTGAPSDVLSNDPNFQKVVGALPASNYNILVVSDTAKLVQLMDNNRASTGDMLRAILTDAYTAIGATIIDGASPTIDIAQTGLPEDVINLINTPVDPAFTQYIPTNATGVIHGTNLIAPYNALIDIVSAQTGQDLRAQLQQAYSLFGMDVIELLFSGDFAMYFTYKSEAIDTLFATQLEALQTDSFATTPFSIEDVLDFGYIFEITDATQAQSLIDQLFMLFGMLGANAGVSVAQEEIAGRNVLVITAENLGGELQPLSIVVGVNDTVFVVGTRQSATAILAGETAFNSNPFYQTSLRYTLPSMTHYWFLDRNSLNMMGGLFGILSPQVGMVSSSIIIDMDTRIEITPNATDVARQQEMMRDQNIQSMQNASDFNNGMKGFAQLFDNTTISVSSKEGILFVRAVITLSQ
ncbi:MAG: DUF3352 domain-containing protein [Anaerolineae bacterium]|jgi:hypothetical protein|nr:DUF3352 domain-containing protein [Anaerolineae bacterium]